MAVITRRECPTHGPNSGSFVSEGVRYCTRCYPKYVQPVAVEYVPRSQLEGAVEALRSIAAGRETFGGGIVRPLSQREMQRIAREALAAGGQ